MFSIILVIVALQQGCNSPETLSSGFVVGTPIHLGDLVFFHPQDQLISDTYRPAKWNDVVDHEVALFQSRPSTRILAAIKWATETEWSYQFESMTLQKFEGDKYLWSVRYHLLPAQGGMTGVPHEFQTVVTGHGDFVEPRIAYWSAYPVDSSHWIRCMLPESELKVSSGPPLFGDAIRTKAESGLQEFVKQAGGIPTSDREVRWIYHSQELVEGFEEGARIWKVYFVGGEICEEDENPSQARRLCVFVSEQGRCGTLTLGGEKMSQHAFILSEPAKVSE